MSPPQSIPSSFTSSQVDIELLDNGDDSLWNEWRNLVLVENWTLNDVSVLSLLPSLPSTKAVFARNKKDGIFIGCVVWSENDGMAYIGFYVMNPSLRGQGLGPGIWKRAMERIPHEYVIGLRAVPSMVGKYKEKDTPIEGDNMYKFTLDCQQFIELLSCWKESNEVNIKRIENCSEEEKEKLIRYDEDVTGRDRSIFLSRYLHVPQAETVMAIDSEGRVCGYSSLSPTSSPGSHLYKLAPLFTSNINVAVALLRPLLHHSQVVSSQSKILLHLLEGTRGDELVKSIRSLFPSMIPLGPNQTLFSGAFSNPFDRSRCFIAHCNNSHFDL